MNKIKEKLLQKKNLWHVGAVALFLLISMVYFYPALSNYALDQPDVKNWIGASQEIKDYQETEGQIGWTNAMFSGMPTVQINQGYKGVGFVQFFRDASTLWLPRPVSQLFLYFLSFFVMALSFKIKPYIAIIGAIAFGLSSSHIIILEAGHMTKAFAIGFAPLVIAGFNYAYRWKNWFLAIGISALFMSFELMANHLQITYYLIFILVALGISEFVKVARGDKNFGGFIKSSAGLLIAYGLAFMINIGNIIGTAEYAEHTTRGGTELTIGPDGAKNEEILTSGLDREYITAWSYGRGETFTFMVPNFKGGSTMRIGDNDANESIITGLDNQYKNDVKNQNQYWGEQPFTSGPVYLGIIVMFLAVLALIYSEEKSRWGLFVVVLLTVMLSWGKNFMGFTNFFLDYFPGYNKFRAVTIILAVAQLCVPLLAVMFLNKLIKAKDEISKNLKPLLITSGAFLGLILLFLAAPSLFNNFLTEGEVGQLETIAVTPGANPQVIAYYEGVFAELETARISIFRQDVLRSFLFLVLGAGTIFLFIRSVISKYVLAGILALLMLLDLGLVSKRYLSNEEQGQGYKQWVETWKQQYPYKAGNGDLEILNKEAALNPEITLAINNEIAERRKTYDEDISGAEKSRIEDWIKFRVLNRMTNYRVFDLANPFNSSYASYFHKSIGGYHGAKLGKYQEMIEFHIGKQNPAVLDMLNMKYQIASQGGPSGGIENSQFVSENTSAMGNAWFTKKIKPVANADEEIVAMNSSKAYKLQPGAVFPVLVNKKPITSETFVSPNDEISFINTVMADSIEKLDTMLIDVPFQAIAGDKLSYIPDPQQGNLTWAYDSMLDSTFMKIITVESGGRIGWDPRLETIVNADFKAEISQDEYSGEGSISMTSYGPDQLEYKSSSNDVQLAVFSEIFYPKAWKAYVDDKEVKILKVNYLLRAIELPAGEHDVKFVYHSDSYEMSGSITYASTALIILFIGFGLFVELKKTKEPSADTAEN